MKNIPEPLLNQIISLTKGLDEYLMKDYVYIIHDPKTDTVVGHYSTKIGAFVPNYKYFMLLDYIGMNSSEEYEDIFNNLIIPNMDLPHTVKLSPKFTKSSGMIDFIDKGFRIGLEKGDAKKILKNG